MKNIKIFLCWLLSVMLGSISLPLVARLTGLVDVNSLLYFNDFEYYFFIVIVASILSAIFSIPTLTTLLIRNSIFSNKDLSLPTWYRKTTKTHGITASINIFIVLLIYLLIMLNTYFEMRHVLPENQRAFTNVEFIQPLIYLMLICLWYAFISFCLWILLFRKERKLKKQDSN